MFFGNTWIITKISAFCNISSISAPKIASRYFLITHTNVPLTLRHESSENCEKIAILQNYFYAYLNHLNLTKISAFHNISSIPVLKIAFKCFLITHTNVPPSLRHDSIENSKKIAILQYYFYALRKYLNCNQNLSFLQHFFNFCTQDC